MKTKRMLENPKVPSFGQLTNGRRTTFQTVANHKNKFNKTCYVEESSSVIEISQIQDLETNGVKGRESH